MKGGILLFTAAAIIVVSCSVVESFAPPSTTSRRVRGVDGITTSKDLMHHHDHEQDKLSLVLQSSRVVNNNSPLFASNNDNDECDHTAAEKNNSTPKKRRRTNRFISNIRSKTKPITLALLTTTSSFLLLPNLRTLLIPPAQASAPIVLRANKKKDDPPMVQAQKKAEELKKSKSLDEFDRFMEKANDIEVTQGKAARDSFEKQYQLDKDAAEVQKQLDIIQLKQKLLDAGQDPHTDLDAERQVWLLEHDLDLGKVSGTPQNEQMIKRAMKRGKLSNQESQRYIIACQVADLKARGINPMEHFDQPDVIDKTRAIYKMDDKVASQVATQYEQLMEQYNGRLTPPGEGEVPFKYDTPVLADAVVNGDNVKALGGDAKAKRREERVALKAKRAAEREARLKEKAETKALRVEERANAKADRDAAREEKKAAKLAATATAGAAAAGASAAASSAVAVGIHDMDIAATANGDVSATAGDNAVSSSSSVVTKKATPKVAKSSSSSKVNDILSQVKQVATPKNVGTVVIGGGAAVYGFNYYKENNNAAVKSREEQLKLILGNDEDDDDDDEFDDDDDDEDDDYEQFTKKKPSSPPPTQKPKSEDTVSKATPPSTPPPPPAPAKPTPRRLGIFAKRNANARETDLNVLVSPSAKSPEFATLLTQILTFGAPGRFPAVSSWSTPMPFDNFDLEEAKSSLTSSRETAELTDEESAEIFASVVNCMIIDIVDLASAALKSKSKDKDDKVAVDAINVVMDFMDHAASLFDAVAQDVTIKPVTYGGKVRKKDLEQMFSVYAGSSMMSLDALAGGGTSQDRVDTLQLVFAITDKKAEGLMQKHMMKMMMNLMKDGGEGLEGMMGGLEGMEGMEGMEDMMKAMGGAGGMGLPGMDGEISPEELKQTLGMMKDMMESGQVSEDELVEVRQQFKEMYGSDISDLVKKATEEGSGEGMTDDERELLELFKTILGE